MFVFTYFLFQYVRMFFSWVTNEIITLLVFGKLIPKLFMLLDYDIFKSSFYPHWRIFLFRIHTYVAYKNQMQMQMQIRKKIIKKARVIIRSISLCENVFNN